MGPVIKSRPRASTVGICYSAVAFIAHKGVDLEWPDSLVFKKKPESSHFLAFKYSNSFN